MSFLLAVLLIAFAALSRFVPHPENFTPIAAMALFGGVYFGKRYAFVVPLVAMVVSDYFIGFHNTVPYVYGSFVLAGLIGIWLKNHKSVGWIVGASLTSSVLFFVVTNFGVWVTGGYPQNFGGLVECYIAAIPFFRNTVLGDLLYVGVLFGLYESALHFMRLREAKEA
ncbi:MAG: DUF6580 family putative transport protein [Bacteroidota bacterium]